VIGALRSHAHLAILRAVYGDRLSIDRGVFLGPRTRIRLAGDGRLTLGPNARIADSTILVGDRSRVVIGADSAVARLDLHVLSGGAVSADAAWQVNQLTSGSRTQFIARGGEARFGERVFIDGGSYRVLEDGRLTIGDRASIGIDTEIRAELEVRIGRYTMIAYGVAVFDTNTHSLDPLERREEVDRYPAYERGHVDRAAVEIGDDCWLGRGAAVLKGARIGDRTIVGLNTTVTAGTYPADSTIVGGEPKLRSLSRDRSGSRG